LNRPALLDVNVLVALFDPDHAHHEPAHRWFAIHRPACWATCPLTENGLIRVLANPAYSPAAVLPAMVLDRLRTFSSSGGHVFWPDDVSFRDTTLFHPGAPASHRQVTDLYLVGLAVRHNGFLATFDRSIPFATVRGAEEGHILLVPA
jgi:toxin-antitoxin system PIN domain toxin